MANAFRAGFHRMVHLVLPVPTGPAIRAGNTFNETVPHDSTRAALIYLHSSAERQRSIADQVGRNAKAALGKSRRSGTQRARDRVREL